MKWQTKIRFAEAPLNFHPVERRRIMAGFTGWKMDLIEILYPIAYSVGVTIKWVNQHGMKVSSD